VYKDLRGFILAVDALGALRRIDDADPRHEIGGITEVAAGLAACPALLFDRIKGFPAGTRVFTIASIPRPRRRRMPPMAMTAARATAPSSTTTMRQRSRHSRSG